jgi:hypothetical protein
MAEAKKLIALRAEYCFKGAELRFGGGEALE